jgi:TPR repeat protein
MRRLPRSFRRRGRRGALLTIGLAGLCARAVLAADPALEQDRAQAAAGDPAALVRLAERYETADGVPFDLGAASALLELAAERGEPVAQYRLGLLQASGLDPEADLAEAYGWLRLAAQHGEDAPGLLAGAIGDALAGRLDEAAIERAEQRLAAFEPSSGPAELPVIAGAIGPGDPASLAALLPPMGCGAPETLAGADGAVTLLAYAPAGTIADAAITPGIRADLASQGAALDITELSPALCAIRAVTAAQQGQPGADGVALVGAAEDARALFRDGDELAIDLAAADEPRYVAVDYVVHTGQVLHLHPAAGEDGHLPAGEALRLGGPDWRIGPPYGEDLVLVTLSPGPFGADRQPAQESAEAYQARLQQRLQAENPVHVFERVIETRAR